MRCSRTSALGFFALGLIAFAVCSSGQMMGAGNGQCPITYPASGFYGDNVFFPGTTAFQSEGTAASYELAADVPLGSTLSFTMTLLGGSGGMQGVGPIWYLTESDFRFTNYDSTSGQQMFMSRLVGMNETQIMFSGTGQARVDFYECGSATATRVETISWQPLP